MGFMSWWFTTYICVLGLCVIMCQVLRRFLAGDEMKQTMEQTNKVALRWPSNVPFDGLEHRCGYGWM